MPSTVLMDCHKKTDKWRLGLRVVLVDLTASQLFILGLRKVSIAGKAKEHLARRGGSTR